MANSYFILQIHHAKSFKMRHITYLYFSYLSRYSLIQIQVTIFLSGTDVSNILFTYRSKGVAIASFTDWIIEIARRTLRALTSTIVVFAWTLAIFDIANIWTWSFFGTFAWIAIWKVIKTIQTLVTPWSTKSFFANTLTIYRVANFVNGTLLVTIAG